jgi:hypothetical protein
MESSNCPKCKSKDVIPIVYGKPSNQTLERSERGEIKLGGCCLYGNDLKSYCKNCKNEF